MGNIGGKKKITDTHTYVFRRLARPTLRTTLLYDFIAVCLVCDLCRFFFFFFGIGARNRTICTPQMPLHDISDVLINSISNLIDMDHFRNVGFVFRFFFLFIILSYLFFFFSWHKIKFVCAEKKKRILAFTLCAHYYNGMRYEYTQSNTFWSKKIIFRNRILCAPSNTVASIKRAMLHL